MSDELSLYKLIVEQDEDEWSCVSEYGWVIDDEFLVFVYNFNVEDFIKGLKDIFGVGLFDNGGFKATVKENYMCFDLCEILESYIDIEEIFPKDKYRY